MGSLPEDRDQPGLSRLLIVRPNLGMGGADRITLTLLETLRRSVFDCSLALLREEGALVPFLPSDVRLHVLGNRRLARALPALTALVRQEQPDILFSTSSGANPVVSLAHWRARSRARLVLSERSSPTGKGITSPRRLLQLLSKRVAYHRADCIACVSDGVRDEVIRLLRVRPSKVLTVHNPVASEEIQEQAQEAVDVDWFSEDVPVLLAAGRLIDLKDFPTLLQAFARVRRIREARLVLLGEGPARRRLETLAVELGVGGDVLLPGFVANPYRYMARATVFVSSSRTEGLPGVLVEAMACGAPVVATACSGNVEVVDDATGVLVPVGDQEGMATAILGLLADGSRRTELAAAGRESVRRRFDRSRIVRRYERVLLGEIDER